MRTACPHSVAPRWGVPANAAPTTASRTLNRVAESAKVASAKHIAPQMNSRQAAVKRRSFTQKAAFKRLWATLVAKDRALQLMEFMAGSKKPTQQPGGKRGLVKAKVYGKPTGNRDMNTHLINVKYSGLDFGSLTGYGYLQDYDDAVNHCGQPY